jgi:hypothetical protein
MTPVIFRIEGEYTRDVVAFFPYAEANHGMLVSYAHVGQHSEASLGYYGNTMLPRESDQANVDSLRAELIGQGYDNLKEYKRMPSDFRDHAWGWRFKAANNT